MIPGNAFQLDHLYFWSVGVLAHCEKRVQCQASQLDSNKEVDYVIVGIGAAGGVIRIRWAVDSATPELLPFITCRGKRLGAFP